MSDIKSYSALSRRVVDVAPFNVMTVDYVDTKPNYFRVQNTGGTAIYCSASKVPSTQDYDFMVKADSMKCHAEPFNKTRFYIYNPSGSTIRVIITSFEAEFDPLAMVLGNIEVDMPSTIESNTAISAFKSALPAGSNKIGKVDLTNDATYIAALEAIKTAIENQQINLDADSIQLNVKDYSEVLGSILTAAEASATVDYSAKLDNILAKIGDNSKPATRFGSGSTNSTIAAGTGKKISELVFFSNDSEVDMSLTLTDGDSTTTAVAIKAGEVLNNVPMWATSIAITANGGAYRYCYGLKSE